MGRTAVLLRSAAAFFATLLLLLGPRALAAQADATRPPRGHFEVWGGFARGSSEWGALGETPGMNLGLIALRWSSPLGQPRAVGAIPRWEISFDVIPLARISTPLRSFRPCLVGPICVLPPPPNGDEGFFPDESPFAVGVNPIGLTRRFSLTPILTSTIGATAGALLFGEPVPTTAASAFNFTASLELGVRIGRPTGRTFSVTYRALHLSNGGLRFENPAVLSHVVSLGLQVPRAERRRER